MDRTLASAARSLRDADQKMILPVGRFCLSISCQREHLAFLPLAWQDLPEPEGASKERFILSLEETSSFPDRDLTEGWNGFLIENRWHALFCQNGKPIFCLRYQSPARRIDVLVPTFPPTSVSLGIQYGMLTALHKHCVGLHGVTLLCGNEIIILSAPSGTGKTTLAHLLETYCDAIVINGDFALLSVSAEGVIFEPTPFCGSSGRSLNHRLHVNRVVFLSQARTNTWQTLTGREAMLQFLNNSFIPIWDEEMKLAVQENIMKCIAKLTVDAFSFAPERNAAEMLCHQITLQ